MKNILCRNKSILILPIRRHELNLTFSEKSSIFNGLNDQVPITVLRGGMCGQLLMKLGAEASFWKEYHIYDCPGIIPLKPGEIMCIEYSR